MKWFGRSIVALVVIGGICLAIYSQKTPEKPAPTPEPSQAVVPTPEPTPSPSPTPVSTLYPVPAESLSEATKALPQIDESDSHLEAELIRLIGKDRFDSIFNKTNIVRRIVVSVDNASKVKQIPQEFSPFKALEKNFHTEGQGEELRLSAANFSRYSAYVLLARTIDMEKLAQVYIHFYPLFQAGFQDLGVKGYFNDRVIAAIDVVVAAPEVSSPIKLIRAPVQPVYKFADPKLEALPAVQKIMLRMGPENATIIKTKLRELREIFSHLSDLKSSK